MTDFARDTLGALAAEGRLESQTRTSFPTGTRRPILGTLRSQGGQERIEGNFSQEQFQCIQWSGATNLEDINSQQYEMNSPCVLCRLVDKSSDSRRYHPVDVYRSCFQN